MMPASKLTKEKVLLLLSAGVALSLSRTPKQYFKIVKNFPKEWRNIELKRLYRVVREFYNDRMVDYKESEDGTVSIVLTKEGIKKSVKFKLDEMKIEIPPK